MELRYGRKAVMEERIGQHLQSLLHLLFQEYLRELLGVKSLQLENFLHVKISLILARMVVRLLGKVQVQMLLNIT